MKKEILVKGLLTIMVLALMAVPGCGKKEESGNKTAAVSTQDVKKEAKEAYDTTKAYTQEQIQAFQQETEDKLAQYKKDIDQLQAKAERFEGDAKAKAGPELTILRQKRDAVSEKLKDLSSSSADAWGQIKFGVDAALADLGSAYEKAVAEFGKP